MYKQLNHYISKNTFLLNFILTFMLFGIFLCGNDGEKTIHIASDEFGYWTAAANFLHWDWSNCASLNSYYSYGYGILLAPLLLLFSKATTAYNAAIILNIIFIVLSYNIWNIVFTKLFSDAERSIIILCSFCVACYPCNYINTKLTLSECLLWFLFSLIVWSFQKFVLSKKIMWLIFSYSIGLYMVMVHMRSIGVLCTLFICSMFYSFYNYRIKTFIWINLLLVLILTLVLCLAAFEKNQLISSQYAQSVLLARNDVSGQLNKINMFLSLNGMLVFLLNICGRMYYLGFSTALLIYFGFVFCINAIIRYKKAYKSRESNLFIYLFFVLSFVFALSISAIYMHSGNGARIDSLIYGRYSEYVIGPIVFCGLFECIHNKADFKFLFFIMCIQIVLTLVVVKVISVYKMKNTIDVSIPAFFFLLKKYGINSFWISVIILSAIIIPAYFLLRKHVYRNIFILIIVLCLFYITLGHKTYQISAIHKSDKEYIDAYEMIKNFLDTTDDIYYLYDSKNVGTYSIQFIDILQFSLKNRSIIFKTTNELADIPKGVIVVIRPDLKMDLNAEMSALIFENTQYKIFWR